MNFFNASRDDKIRRKLEDAGVGILPATGYGFKLIKYLIDFSGYSPSLHTLELAIPDTPKSRDRLALSEHDSKMELVKYYFPVPKEAVLSSLSELKVFAEEVEYPVAAKIASPDILHKSDIGGVKLNIQNKKDLMSAYMAILQNATLHNPEARIDGVLVQPMLPKGIEVIIGVNNDPQFGPMLLCGLGGIFVEIFKDVSLYPAPLSKQEALEMIQSLKGYQLLNGYRGNPEYDIDALADFMVKVAAYAAENKNSLHELDINPVFVYEKGRGVAVADALIIKTKESN